MIVKLTEGVIERICRDDMSCFELEEFGPVLQVIDVKLYRLLLSDGTHSNAALLDPELEELVLHEMLQIGSIVRLTNFTFNVVTKPKVIIISHLEIVRDKHRLIGKPFPSHLIQFSDGIQDSIMEMDLNLTQGAIERMYSYNFSCDEEEFKPVLQVIHMESSPLWLSDGTHSTIAIISPDLEEEYVHPKNHSLSLEDPCATFRRFLHNGSFVKLTNFKLETLTHTQITGVGLEQAAIARMCSNKFSFDKEFKPVLQVIHMNIPHLLLSDGLCYNTAILPRNLLELVHSGRLQKGSFVQLTHFTASLIQNHKVIIIFDLYVILDKCELIGEPVQLPKNAHDLVVISDKGELIGEPYSTTPSKCTFKTIC